MRKLVSILFSTLKGGVKRGLLFLALVASMSTAFAYDAEIDGKSDLREATFERIGTDSVWFEDLLTYLGIEIWE